MGECNIYCLKESSTSKKLSWHLSYLATHFVFPQWKAGIILIWHEIPRPTPQCVLPPAWGDKIPLQSAKGVTIVNLLKQAGGPCHYCFYYCLNSPRVSANCLPVRFGKAQSLTDFLSTASKFFLGSIFFTCCFSLSVTSPPKKILKYKFKFEKRVPCLFGFFGFLGFFPTRSTPPQGLYPPTLMGNWKTSTGGRAAPPLNLYMFFVDSDVFLSTFKVEQPYWPCHTKSPVFYFFSIWVEKVLWCESTVYSIPNSKELSVCAIKRLCIFQK